AGARRSDGGGGGDRQAAPAARARARPRGTRPDTPRRGNDSKGRRGALDGGDGHPAEHRVQVGQRAMKWLIVLAALLLPTRPPAQRPAAPLTIARLHYDGGGDW